MFHPRLDFRFAVQIHAAEPHPAVGGCGEQGHVHPVAAMEADAGKRRRTVESLLIEHDQIEQNTRAIGKFAFRPFLLARTPAATNTGQRSQLQFASLAPLAVQFSLPKFAFIRVSVFVFIMRGPASRCLGDSVDAAPLLRAGELFCPWSKRTSAAQAFRPSKKSSDQNPFKYRVFLTIFTRRHRLASVLLRWC